MTWVALLAGSAACYLMKLAGLSLPSRVIEHPRVQRVAVLLPVAVLAGLIAQEVFTSGNRLSVGPSTVGVGAAVVAVAWRAPFLVVVLVAVVVTALVRLA